MQILISKTKESMGASAASQGASLIRNALREKGSAAIIVATGASQFEMLDQLVREPDINWKAVTAFHLDEYIGLSMEHPASFRRYLKERFVDRLPEPVGAFHYIQADDNPEAEVKRLNELISGVIIDVAFVGIGENGHLAFNDPPADFATEEPYLIVRLDEACRKQQLGEGWFDSLEEVPEQAISMSVRQIMKSRAIICTVPDERKAVAVKNTVEGSVTPEVPASILQQHPNCRLLLDEAAALKLRRV